MPLPSASNRIRLAYKLEGVYPENFGVRQAGNGTALNLTGESLKFDVKNERSKQLRDDRLTQDIVQVGATAQGGINFEAQYKEYDPFVEAVVQNDFVVYGTLGISAAATGTLTRTSATVITASVAPTGVDALTNLRKGQWFAIVPADGESAAVKKYLKARAFRVSPATAPTTTALTLDSATPMSGTIITAPLLAGWKLSSSYAVNGNQMKSFNLEVGHGDIAQFRLYTGMVPSKMDLKLASGSIVSGSFEFMGQGFDLIQTSSMGTPTAAQSFTPANATRGVFDILEGGVSISASTFIKSVDFSIDNTLRMQDAVGVFGSAGIGNGTMNIMAKMSMYFSDHTHYRKLLDGAASSFSLPILDADGNGYVYFMPRIKYTAAAVNADGQDQDNMLSCDVEGLPETDVTSPWFGKAVVVFRVGSPAALVGALRPRWGLGNATAGVATAAALFAAMTNEFGTSGTKSGTTALTTTTGNYAWFAVLASASAAGVTFTGPLGTGGFSGASSAGNNTGASPTPSTSVVTYTDGSGNVWRFFRADYAHSDPVSTNYTLS